MSNDALDLGKIAQYEKIDTPSKIEKAARLYRAMEIIEAKNLIVERKTFGTPWTVTDKDRKLVVTTEFAGLPEAVRVFEVRTEKQKAAMHGR